MSLDRLAKDIAQSLARHQSRGLVDDAMGMTDVVIHGRVDLLAVADDVLAASLAHLRPARISWGGWFTARADAGLRARRQDRLRRELAEKLDTAGNPADAAIIRLKTRELGGPGE